MFCSNLFLRLLELGEGHKEVFLHIVLPEELHRPLIHFPAVGDVAVLLFKTSVLDPVLHFGVNDDEYRGVKEFFYTTNKSSYKPFSHKTPKYYLVLVSLM